MGVPVEAIRVDEMPDLKLRKGNAVYHALKGAILLSRLAPGAALLEQQIAAEMGCSQGTVREALLRLQDDGLVQRRGYRGTFVSSTTIAEAAEMAVIRIRIEQLAIRRAQRVFDAAARSELVAILERMETANESGNAYAVSELDRQFHLTLFKASGMPMLEPVLSRCALHMHRYTFANDPARKQEVSPVETHAPILNALETGDPDKAALAIRQHIEAVLQRWSPELLPSVRDQAFI